MKFGKLKDISNIDFNLPEEPKKNLEVLTNKSQTFKIYLGAPAWGVPDWKGKVYPPKTKSTDFLKYYSKMFNSIELNSVHYRLPPQERVLGWVADVPKDFKFCPKVSQEISHYGGLTKISYIQKFVDCIKDFGENLGIVFLQLSENVKPSRIKELEFFIKNFPKDISLAIEVRHEDWFNQPNPLFDFMQEHDVSTVITDVPARRDVLHMRLTNKKVVIRFNGNELDKTDFERADAWIDKMKYWVENGVEEIYFFLHEPDEIVCPELADYMIEKMQKVGLTDMNRIEFFNKEAQIGLL